MKNPTFQAIETIGHIIEENEQYRHYHYPEMLVRYDSNFIDFKKMPSLEEFKQAELFLKEYHQKYNQSHLKFEFPENQKPGPGLLKYMDDNRYDTGFLELYAIRATEFPVLPSNPNIQVEEVIQSNLNDFIKLQYENDIQNGENFADEKVKLTKKQLAEPGNMKVLAYYQDEPAGTMNLILTDNFVEIDDLAVKESLQRKGIGGRMQQFAMNRFPDKTFILVADGEDTPREMYQRQNYKYLGYKYEGLKIESALVYK